MKPVQSLLRLMELIPCFMVLATVFVVNRELANGVVAGKYFWFYLSMGVLAVQSVINVFLPQGRNGFTQGAQSANDWLIPVFGVITLTVSYFVNGSEAITKHILLILLVLLYFYFRMAFQTHRSAYYWLPVFLMVTGLVEAVWGLRQLYGFSVSQHSLFRLTGSFFNPGPYSGYLAVVLPVTVYYLLRDWSCVKIRFQLRYWPVYLRWGLALVTFVCVLTVLPASMSRAAWLGAIGGCGVVFSFFSAQRHGEHKGSQRKIVWIAVVSLALLAGCAGMYYLKKDSADGRAFIWKNAVQTVWHHPMGVGIGNFSGSYGETQAAYFASGKSTEREEYVAGNPEYAFNEYLQICIEHGIIPFVGFMGIVFLSLRSLIVSRKWGMAGSMVSLLVFAFFSYPFSVLPFLIVFVFLLAVSGSTRRTTLRPIHRKGIGIQMITNRNCKSATISKVYIICVLFLCLSITAFCLYKEYPKYRAYKKWNTDRFLYSAGLYSDVVKNHEELYPLLNDQIRFLFEYAQSLSKTERYKESNRVLEKAVRISCDPMLYNVMGNNFKEMEEYDKAETMYLRASQIVPNRVYPYYLLTHLYIAAGDTVKAKEMAQLVLTREPKVQSTAIREMRSEMKKLFPNE